jgi:hypothetical protein
MADTSPAVAFWVPTRHIDSDREVRGMALGKADWLSPST